MAAPPEIVRLVETFERNKETYRSGGLDETQLRREFLDPFFKGLGWDVDNMQGWAEPYKRVIHDAVRGRRRQISWRQSSARLRQWMPKSISLCTSATV
jgi:hypothetical protein